MVKDIISDFGKKIGGAKKDIWRYRGLKVEDLDDIDLREYMKVVTKNNIWPIEDYKEYLEMGMEPVCIYFIKTVRDKLKSSIDVRNDGKDRERAEAYIEFVWAIRHSCLNLRVKDDIKNFKNNLLLNYGYMDELGRFTHKLYKTQVLDRKFLSVISPYDREIERLRIEAEIMDFPNDFRGDLKGIEIYISYFDSKYYINKSGKRLINTGFNNFEDALNFCKTKLKDMLDSEKDEDKKDKTIIRVVRPQLRHIERTGPDVRRGKDATTDTLLEVFKFRGGEFGNWNTQLDRQAYLNYAFDAFVDLAYLLKCPLDFISFSPVGGYNGNTLAIAFGARGSGNSVAHYEYGRVVINLSKMKGDGCLAHEWAHALDDFLGYNCGLKGLSTFLSECEYKKATKYKEVADAMKNVMDTITKKKLSMEYVINTYKNDIRKKLDDMLRNSLNLHVKTLYNTIDVTPIIETANKLCLTGSMDDYKLFIDTYNKIVGKDIYESLKSYIEIILRDVQRVRRNIEMCNNNECQPNMIIETDYYERAKFLDKTRSKKYYSVYAEMFARAFESYVEDKLGFKSQYLVHSTQNTFYGELKPYPSGDERERINSAIENLLKVVVDTFADKSSKLNYSIYTNNTDFSNKYDVSRMKNNSTKGVKVNNTEGVKVNNTEGVKVNSAEKQQSKQMNDINTSRELREFLVDTAFEILKGLKVENIDYMYNIIKERVSTKLNMGNVTEDIIAYKDTKGNSRAWRVKNGMLVVNIKDAVEKKLEGLIEPVVKVIILNKFGNKSESDMITSGVTYMICKRLGLDVRTYCLTAEYDKLVKNKAQLSNYINICKEMYIHIFNRLGFTV